MTTGQAIALASTHLRSLGGHVFDVLSLTKPLSAEAALDQARVLSKLTPFLGNLIEINQAQRLNEIREFQDYGKWVRQDPGFPDIIFEGSISPPPGFEIKAWFPLATEITGRFKDSQNRFERNETHVALIAWLPEQLLFGKPAIIDVCVVSAQSVAAARDTHYHNPPDYLVLEPEDTSRRTRNLQQTNTSGYKWQGAPEEVEEASRIVDSWGSEGRQYQTTHEYQELLRQLTNRFRYRLDTNFAKMDRIAHDEIEAFKRKVLATPIHGRTILEWQKVLFRGRKEKRREVLSEYLEIVDRDAQDILE